ncbi:MAG TPA: SHOCT domain-containing protein [Chitinophagaceae bacterium]|nr:SHOCT domain-containing protein [Chitinophagaceae bacterium]
MNFKALHKQKKYILVAAAAGILSIFLPWLTVSAGIFGESISRSTNGFSGIGILAFFGFAAAGVLTFTGNNTLPFEKGTWMASLGAAAVSLLSVLIFMANTSGSLGSAGFAEAHFGFGLWISLVAAIALAASAWFLKSPEADLQSGLKDLKKNITSHLNTSSPVRDVPAGKNRLDELERLITLKNEGKISEDEYNEMKAKIF